MTEPLDIPEPAGGWAAPWPAVFELADALGPTRWALVGGLMVQTHALAAGVPTTRVTLDVDAVVRVEAGVSTYATAAAALARLGYVLDDSPRLAYRFVRGREVVDLMVADHTHPPPRYDRRPVMAIDGGRQALDRTQTAHFATDDGVVDVPVPSLHGALVLKAAAHLVDPRDRERHLLDAVTLLACIVDAGELVSGLRGSDGKRLRHLVRAFDEMPLVTSQAPRDTRELARRAVDDLRAALG